MRCHLSQTNTGPKNVGADEHDACGLQCACQDAKVHWRDGRRPVRRLRSSDGVYAQSGRLRQLCNGKVEEAPRPSKLSTSYWELKCTS